MAAIFLDIDNLMNNKNKSFYSLIFSILLYNKEKYGKWEKYEDWISATF
ncbi:hypothetical protein U8V97_14585 [Priestia filamentosa]|nr:hypothetical protein [Priestia filamentosa]